MQTRAIFKCAIVFAAPCSIVVNIQNTFRQEQSDASHTENLRTSKTPNSKQPTSTEQENMIIEPDIGIPEIKTKTEADRIIELWQSGLTVSDIAAQVQGTRKIIRKCIDR